MKKIVLASLLGFTISTSAFAASTFVAKKLDVSPDGVFVQAVVGDVDADGRNELVVLSGAGPLKIYSVSTSGDTTLEATVDVQAPLDSSWSYAQPRVLDVDGDGDRDIALYLRSSGSPGMLQLVKWNGGSFSVEGPYVTPESDAAYGFDMGDIDGDGIADAVTANHGLNAPQGIFVASGASGFTSSVSYPWPYGGVAGAFGETQRGIVHVYARDLDLDGRVDVAASSGPYNSVSGRIFWNRAGLGLSTGQNLAGRASIELGIGDQNNDGRPDIIANGHLASDIRVYRGPQFTSTSLFRTPLDPRTPLVGDFNGDARPDIAMALTVNKEVLFILAGSSGGQWHVTSPDLDAADFMSGTYKQELAAGDVDNDGKLDLVFATDRVVLIRYDSGDAVPPVLSLPANITAEATSPAGAAVTWTATATDAVSGSVAVQCTPASGSTFAIGTTTVNCSAKDAANNIANGSFSVTVRDTTAPAVTSISATPNTLGAPNHKMVAVRVTIASKDSVDAAPAARIISVSSNEPQNGLGDGDTGRDWNITGPLTLELRAERSGNGNGRIYTITVQVTDRSGNATTATTQVTVRR
ncbi:MAG TPA: FG-GAP-like repeat-containing protein [Thermoanaerobaculia bacterium]